MLADGRDKAVAIFAVTGDGGEERRRFEGLGELVALFEIRRLHNQIGAIDGPGYGVEDRGLRLRGA